MKKILNSLMLMAVVAIASVAGVGCSSDDDDNPVAPAPAPEVVISKNVSYYHYVDLETAEVDSLTGPGRLVLAKYDMYMAYNSRTAVHGVAVQQGVREMAHLPNRTFKSVTKADIATAVFSTRIISDPFDPKRVILIKTDSSTVYKLGNASENNTTSRFSFDYAKLSD